MKREDTGRNIVIRNDQIMDGGIGMQTQNIFVSGARLKDTIGPLPISGVRPGTGSPG